MCVCVCMYVCIKDTEDLDKTCDISVIYLICFKLFNQISLSLFLFFLPSFSFFFFYSSLLPCLVYCYLFLKK